MRLAEVAIACFVLAATAAPADAQPAEAEELFQEGRALVDAGQIERACNKFEASHRLDPSVGTLLNLGDCRERLGQVATAWATFLAAESLARQLGDDQRADEAARRARALDMEPRTVTVPPPPLVTTRVPIAAEPAPSRWTGMRKLAVVTGALGAASLAGGIAFGVRAENLAERSDVLCPTEICADPEGLRLNQDARANALRANVLFGAAAVSIAGTVALWVLGDPDELSAAPDVGADHIAISLAGTF
jgi:tetratricopeptide (TPR) repeat protein